MWYCRLGGIAPRRPRRLQCFLVLHEEGQSRIVIAWGPIRVFEEGVMVLETMGGVEVD